MKIVLADLDVQRFADLRDQLLDLFDVYIDTQPVAVRFHGLATGDMILYDTADNFLQLWQEVHGELHLKDRHWLQLVLVGRLRHRILWRRA